MPSKMSEKEDKVVLISRVVKKRIEDLRRMRKNPKKWQNKQETAGDVIHRAIKLLEDERNNKAVSSALKMLRNNIYTNNYLCDYCNMRFPTKIERKIHMKLSKTRGSCVILVEDLKKCIGCDNYSYAEHYGHNCRLSKKIKDPEVSIICFRWE